MKVVSTAALLKSYLDGSWSRHKSSRLHVQITSPMISKSKSTLISSDHFKEFSTFCICRGLFNGGRVWTRSHCFMGSRGELFFLWPIAAWWSGESNKDMGTKRPFRPWCWLLSPHSWPCSVVTKIPKGCTQERTWEDRDRACLFLHPTGSSPWGPKGWCHPNSGPPELPPEAACSRP